jgi:hypothetical protein
MELNIGKVVVKLHNEPWQRQYMLFKWILESTQMNYSTLQMGINTKMELGRASRLLCYKVMRQ